MIAVTYRIQLEEPLLATSLEGEPNSAISFDYIPGSLTRGAVAGQLAQNGVDIAQHQRYLFFSRVVRYLNAYPVLEGETVRRLPTPASWKVKKLEAKKDDAQVQDFALLAEAERRATGQTKDLSGFTPGTDVDRTRYRPKHQIAVHTLRDRSAGRATQALGAVYRYDAITLGEVFLGAVITQTADQADRVKALLGN